jgi:hypothetical protein
MKKAHKQYKLIKIVFGLHAICWAVPFSEYELSGGQSALWILMLGVSGWIYLFLLGSLIRSSGRSAFKWVTLTIVTAPIGIIASYFLLKPIEVEQGWEMTESANQNNE